MKLPSADELQKMVEGRAGRLCELGKWEQRPIDAAAERERLLADPGALENPTTRARLIEIQNDEPLTNAKTKQLKDGLAERDRVIGQLATLVLREVNQALEVLEKTRFAKFCNANAPFHNGGLDSKYFRKHGNSRFPAREDFSKTDSFTDILLIRQKLGKADPSIPDTLRRARALIELVPTIPEQ